MSVIVGKMLEITHGRKTNDVLLSFKISWWKRETGQYFKELFKKLFREQYMLSLMLEGLQLHYHFYLKDMSKVSLMIKTDPSMLLVYCIKSC